ncbi:MAG: alcohol dehydrogenase catalytic domain-containing protein [Chloroflexi bacterium]|nr:alcohol dehydrogenase catalytic domain-containing protein [Chloroflexota bacterium]
MRSFTVPPEQWLFARLYLGVFKPRRPVLGMELAGDVEAVGAKVTRLKPGDPVFASTFDAGWGGDAVSTRRHIREDARPNGEAFSGG